MKDATTDSKQIQRWWARWPQANILIRTGAESNLFVLDIDGGKGGAESLDRLEDELGPLPITVEVLTGGGSHRYFTFPDRDVRNSAGVLGDGLDVRGNGGYVIAPGSVHASGRQYEFKVAYHPDDLPLADVPAWMLDLLSNPVGRGAAVPIGTSVPAGLRNSTLTSFAGSMRRRGMSESSIAAALLEENVGWTEPLPEYEVRDIAASVSRYAPSINGHSPVPSLLDYELTDYGNAERLVAAHGPDLHYVHTWGRWLAWDGKRFRPDETGEAERRAKATVRTLRQQALAAYEHASGELASAAQRTDEDAKKKASKALEAAQTAVRWAARSEAAARIAAMLSLATSEPGIPVVPRDLDSNPWAFNCLTGTLDLRTGTIHEHSREDLITKLAPVEHDPKGTAPTFAAFLERIFNEDAELISYIQRFSGYSLTGDVSEQVMLVFHGTGANGKTTLLKLQHHVMGGYAQSAAPELLLKKDYGADHPTERADLLGARFVYTVEVEAGKALAESLIKLLSGGDTVKARFMYRDFFEFEPTWKLVLAANHKPTVRGTDFAIWRRLHLVPFIVTIPEEERDPKLLDKLKAEASGVLNWMVKGCLEWQRVGLGTPDAVRTATARYRDESDILLEFLEAECVLEAEAEIAKGQLYEAYEKWAEANHEKPIAKNTFSTQLSERGVGDTRLNRKRLWIGIRVRTSDEKVTQ